MPQIDQSHVSRLERDAIRLSDRNKALREALRAMLAFTVIEVPDVWARCLFCCCAGTSPGSIQHALTCPVPGAMAAMEGYGEPINSG